MEGWNITLVKIAYSCNECHGYRSEHISCQLANFPFPLSGHDSLWDESDTFNPHSCLNNRIGSLFKCLLLLSFLQSWSHHILKVKRNRSCEHCVLSCLNSERLSFSVGNKSISMDKPISLKVRVCLFRLILQAIRNDIRWSLIRSWIPITCNSLRNVFGCRGT